MAHMAPWLVLHPHSMLGGYGMVAGAYGRSSTWHAFSRGLLRLAPALLRRAPLTIIYAIVAIMMMVHAHHWPCPCVSSTLDGVSLSIAACVKIPGATR